VTNASSTPSLAVASSLTIANVGAGTAPTGTFVFPGAIAAATTNSVLNAAEFSGSDCGAKINSADASLGSAGGEIDVNQACGTTWTTQAILSANHNLVFTQTGTYVVAGITVSGSNTIDLRGAELQMPAYSSGTAGMFTTYNGSTAASNVWIENGILDGNWSNTPSANTCLYAACRPALRIDNNSNSTAVHDIHFQHIVAQNWNNPVVELINNYPLPYNIWLGGGNVYRNIGTHVIYSFGFDRNFFVRDSYFYNWGVGLTSSHADPIVTFDYTGYAGTSQFTMDISGNTFDNTQVAPDGYGFAAEVGAGGAGWVTDFTFNNNHMNDNGTGTGGCLSGNFWTATITANDWTSEGPCELTGTNMTVAGNTIRNGAILLNAAEFMPSLAGTVSGNTIDFVGPTDSEPNPNAANQKGITVSGYGSNLTATLSQAIRQTAQTFTITSVAFNPQTVSGTPPTIVATGTITGGGSNAYVNWAFTLAGMGNGGNNGTYICTASTGTTLTFANPKGVTETSPSGATAVSSASTTAYVGGYSSWGSFNGMTEQDHIAVTGFSNAGNNSTTLTAIANSLTVLAVTNSSGVVEAHSGTMTLNPSSYNANIGPDSINMGTSTGSCAGVMLGNGADGSGAVYNVSVHDLTVASQPGFSSSCSGIWIATGSMTPESTGFDFKSNVFTNLGAGIRDDATAGTFNDLTLESNKFVNVYTPIYPSSPTVYRTWNNVTSSTQTTEALNGGATVDASGDISSPGWVSGGVITPTASSGAVTWSSAVALNTLTLTGNVTSSTIANGAFDGQEVCFRITQGSSIYTVAWPGQMYGMSPPSQVAGSATTQCAIYDSAYTAWGAVAPTIDGGGNTYLPGTVNAPAIVDRGLTSATLIGTNGSGTLVAASTTGTGNAVLANGPTFTGNTTTFANGAAAEQDVAIQPGTGADQVGALGFNNYAGTSEWKLRKDASNYFKLTDVVNSLDRAIFYQNGQTLLNSGAGSNSVLINSSTGSGTGGFYVESGGSSPAAVFSTTASGNTTATGFVSGKFMMGSGTMSLGAGAAAGSSPTIGCASGHVCDGVSGAVTLTTGTSTTTGTLATLSFPNTHSNSANCVVTPTLSGTGLVTSISWSESTTALTLTANTALTASTAYQIRYWCGGN